MSVLDILVQKNLLTKDDVREVQKQVSTDGAQLDTVLMQRGVSLENILIAKGEFLNIPVRTVNESITSDVLDYIPEESALHYKFVPLALKEGALEVGVVDPDNLEARDALTFITSKKNVPYKIFLISADDFQKVLDMYKGL